LTPTSIKPGENKNSDLKEFNATGEKFSEQAILFVRRHRYYLGNSFEKYYIQVCYVDSRSY